jgi:hypothetical protein
LPYLGESRRYDNRFCDSLFCHATSLRNCGRGVKGLKWSAGLGVWKDGRSSVASGTDDTEVERLLRRRLELANFQKQKAEIAIARKLT